MTPMTAALAALALTTACASTRGDPTASAEAKAETTPAQARGEETLDDLTRYAEWQTGQLERLTDDELRLRSGGGETRLEVSDAEVPVFVEGARVGREALRQGEDVRVFYESGRGANARVVAVEVLGADQATRQREPR